MRGIRNNLVGSSGHRIQILAEPGINVWKLSAIDGKGKAHQKNRSRTKAGLSRKQSTSGTAPAVSRDISMRQNSIT